MNEADERALLDRLETLLSIPSPVGATGPVVDWVEEQLATLGIATTRTRRGALKASMGEAPARAIVVHLDTLGAMVNQIAPNGRLGLASLGTWSSRFAEGARVTLLETPGPLRGTILPRKASGHAYSSQVDEQPVSWDQVEVRIDAFVESDSDARRLGVDVGTFVAIESSLEVSPDGFLNARHLDDKAGVAAVLTAASICQRLQEGTCELLFSISEEIGTGAGALISPQIEELVAVDIAICAANQSSSERAVTLVRGDASGPFDTALTDRLADLATQHKVHAVSDVFRHYKCDGASAVHAGHDVRCALLGFGVDGSHGYERTHIESLRNLVRLLVAFMRS